MPTRKELETLSKRLDVTKANTDRAKEARDLVEIELSAIRRAVYAPPSFARREEIATLSTRLSTAEAALQKEVRKQRQVEELVMTALNDIAPDRSLNQPQGIDPRGRNLPQPTVSAAEQLRAVLKCMK